MRQDVGVDGDAQRISFGDGAYSTPVWSPRGDYIAFTKQTQGKFAIGYYHQRQSFYKKKQPAPDNAGTINEIQTEENGEAQI